MFSASSESGFNFRGSGFVKNIGHGLMVSAVLAIAARFLSDHYGAPSMLMALLLGMAFNFLSEEGRCVAGIEFGARTILRFGVALLGIRISFDLLVGLGPELIALVVGGVVATILFGLVGARLLGRGWRIALVSGGAVAICGASAAMAIAAILPRNQHSERTLLFTVLSVTVLSTLAMIAYPLIGDLFELDDRAAGVFLGGTIHDVAQVVGAGFSISDEAGKTATLVKLIRVSMLAPVVLIFALMTRKLGEPGHKPENRPPLIPGFILAFLFLAAINSYGIVPGWLSEFVGEISRWALLVAIAAVGMKTSLGRIADVPKQSIILVFAETIFIAVFILVGIYFLSTAP